MKKNKGNSRSKYLGNSRANRSLPVSNSSEQSSEREEVGGDRVAIALSNLADPRAQKLLEFHQSLYPILSQAKGSLNSSFSWPGGYLNHIDDTFRIAEILHPLLSLLSKVDLEEAKVVLPLHDIERPIRYARSQGLLLPVGLAETGLGVNSWGKASFYSSYLSDLGIILNVRELYALSHFQEPDGFQCDNVAGEVLAGFCRMCDVYSHRITAPCYGQNRGLSLR